MTETPEAREFFTASGDYDRTHYQSSIRSFISDRNVLLLELLAGLALPRSASLLEVGCGPGHFLAGAWKHCGSLVGVDTAAEMLEQAHANLPPPAQAITRLVNGSITALPFPDDHFDVVVSAGVLEYFADPAEPLAELFRVLRPGGHALLPTTNKLSPALITTRLIDVLKRWPLIMKPFNRIWTRNGRPPVRPRHFRIRLDTPGSHRRAVRAAGFAITAEHYFHFAPLPDPAEQIAPALTTKLLHVTDPLLRTPLRLFAEGFLTICTKPGH